MPRILAIPRRQAPALPVEACQPWHDFTAQGFLPSAQIEALRRAPL